MKNIVLIIDDLVVGGAETTNIRLAEAFTEIGYKVHLIVIKNHVEFQIDKNINFITLNYEKKYLSVINDFIYAKKLQDTLHEIRDKYGKINLTLGSLGLAHSLMNILGDKDFYYVLHGSTTISKLKNKKGISKFFKKYKLKKLYDKKNIISVSNGVQKDIMSLNISPLSIRTIYNFFDFEKIRDLSESPIDIELPQKYIVHVGRFAKVKRHDILIKAFNLLKDKDIKLVLLGDGEEKKNILSLIKSLNLMDRVIMPGFIKNPYPVIKKAQALVLSSEHEGFGNVLVESLILHTIVISTDCPYGPAEILSQEFSQSLCDVGDPISLAETIEKNLKDKPFIKDSSLLKFEKNSIIKEYETLMS